MAGGSLAAGRTPSARARRSGELVAVCVALILTTTPAVAQDLGHKLPGLLGLDAARIPEPGLYFVDRLASYEADELRDRDGRLIPTAPFNLLGMANAFGASYTTRLSQSSVFLTMTVGWPISRIKRDVEDRPEAAIDRFGLADPYVQPVRLGWRNGRSDVVMAYGIYLPTDRSPLAGGKGVSSGQITHEFSGGGSLYFKDRTAFLTALASYQLHMRQRGIDVTRGDAIQIEGGLGTKLFGQLAEAGLAGFAFWQVRDDRGADLPPVLRGARDRVYGLGPEAAIMLKAIRGQVRVRYEWDIGARARPQGHLFVAGLNFFLAQRGKPAGS